MASTLSIREQKETARRKARRAARQAAGGGSGQKGLTMIIFQSIGIAIFGTVAAVILFRVAIMAGAKVNPDLQSLIVMLGFIILFLGSLLTMIKKYLPSSSGTGEIFGGQDVEKKFGGVLQERQPHFDKVFDDVHMKANVEVITLDEQDGFATANSDEAPQPEPEDQPNDQGQGPGGAGPGGAGPNGAGPNGAGPGGAGPNGAGPGGAGPGGAGPNSGSSTSSTESDEAVTEKAMAKVIGHLKLVIADVTKALQSREKAVDSFTKFGLNLYFAGVCSKLSKEFSLSASEGQSVLARLMELTGADKTAAKAFANNVNEYGERAQYRSMIDSGSKAMAHHLDSESEAGEDLGELLNNWSNPDQSVELPSIYTFMFTDIVDSTALTEELGDKTMQKVIRAHNKIVRDALKQFDGKEVKHTGDGIMATFSNPRFAIEACTQMQQQIDLFNRQKAELSFDICIGLHTGEAVEEENDYFGTAVQTAARICAEAGSSETWISDEIWRAVPRYADDCKYCGEFAMKGLKEKKTLYTVPWERLPDPATGGKVGYQELGKK